MLGDLQASFELLATTRVQLLPAAEVAATALASENAAAAAVTGSPSMEPDRDAPTESVPTRPAEVGSAGAGSSGVALQGSVAEPVLCFSPHELGFRDEEHARAVGLPLGVSFPVRLALFNQGVNEEQTMANLMQTNTNEQRRLNGRARKSSHF